MDDVKYGIFGITVFTILVCSFGWAGNGHVVWLLGFHVKRTTFGTYILNLAMADLGTVIFFSVFLILHIAFPRSISPLTVLGNRFIAMKTASLCFLTIICMERCVSVLFPHWYRCHRPKFLSARLSLLIWTLVGVVYGLALILYLFYGGMFDYVIKIMFIVNVWVLPFLVALSTLVLLIKFCCTGWKHSLRSLNIVILLMRFFFFIFDVPYIVLRFLDSLGHSPSISAFFFLFFAVNSSIKPLFYYLVGKQCKCHSAEPLTIAIGRVFQDEEVSTVGTEPTIPNVNAEETCSIQTA